MRSYQAAVVALVALIVLAAACNGAERLPPGVTTTRPPPPPPPTPREVQELEKCEDLVPVGVSFVENMIQVLGGLPVGVLRGEDPVPASVVALEAVGRELDQRAVRLACDVNAINAEIVAETADIESEEPVIALFLEIVRSGIISPLPTGPAPTSSP